MLLEQPRLPVPTGRIGAHPQSSFLSYAELRAKLPFLKVRVFFFVLFHFLMLGFAAETL
jgi:hypothetical protein